MGSSAKKTLLTAVIVLMGPVLAVSLGGGSPPTAYQSQGIAIDFGDRDVSWTDVNLRYFGDPIKALGRACDEWGFTSTINDDTVSEINGFINSETAEWGLWIIEQGSMGWKRIGSPYPNIKDYTIAAWAYCGDGETPSVAIDQYGRSIYGYPQARRVVTLSPSLTEMIGALNAENTLVGMDAYSDYPQKIVDLKNKGDIAIVGGYVNPNFEAIMKTNPDLVFCDGGQYSHYEMAERIRKASVNAIVLYAGESIETIQDNIFIMGTAMGFDLRSLTVLKELGIAESEIIEKISGGDYKPSKAMVALEPVKSPWVSGSYTYFNDVLNVLMVENAFSGEYGWMQVNSESIPKANPNVIIVIADSYRPTETDYQHMLGQLSREWKSTDAYENGRIYMFTDDLGILASRPGPRYAQLMEILYLAFSASPNLPMYIGDNYFDYLEVTKRMGYD